MNTLLRWLTSPEWALIVKALLHTLWQGAAIAVLLGLALRRWSTPATRYRCSLSALAAVLASGVFTWAVLSGSLHADEKISPAAAGAETISTPGPTEVVAPTDPAVIHSTAAQPPGSPPAPSRWTAWLALAWVVGASLMIARAAAQVAGAERLRHSCRPLNDDRIAQLLAEARRAIGLARNVRLAVTERLTSPAVVGVLVPTLILPLSLVTTLTADQLRFILLHELAHIRRGDYLANLFQLFAEAILFFNPAVWWISHQIKREREACCDALAIELSRAPVDYAKTLLHVAENVLSPPPAAAPAFGDELKSSSGLSDRVQRLLVPGYRPALRLTWRAMLTALLLGSALLMLSAVGTRLTIAAILSPQQRIEQIEKKMTEYGQKPEPGPIDTYKAPRIRVSGTVRTADGEPLPKWFNLSMDSLSSRSSYGMAVMCEEGRFSGDIPEGTIYVSGELTNYAPAVIGPFEARGTNGFENLELVFQRGFEVSLKTVDADTDAPIPAAKLRLHFWLPGGHNSGFNPRPVTTDSNGWLILPHCANLPLDITMNAPGYEIVEKRFDSLKPGETLRMTSRRGSVVAGRVLDKSSGAPVGGATLRVLYQVGPVYPGRFNWDDSQRLLGITDGDGRFRLTQLRPDTRYYIGVSAPGHESVILNSITAGPSNLTARLGPELVVKGRITGNLELLQKSNDRVNRLVGFNYQDNVADQNFSQGTTLPVRVESGVGHFQFTNRVAGPVQIVAAGKFIKRTIDTPVDDWLIDLSTVEKTNAPVVKREVVFRFRHESGVPPRGVVTVAVPDDITPGHLTAHSLDLEIQNGEVRATMPVGGYTSIEPKQTIGYWFKNYYSGIPIPAGAGPFIVDVPVIPAGAIFGRARNFDGSPADRIFFNVAEVKPSPQRHESGGTLDSNPGYASGKWVSGPLPLGGTYQVIGSRDNSFCISKPVTLTDEKPEAEVELQFGATKTIEGRLLDPDGKPARGGTIIGTFSFRDRSFALSTVYTDNDGRFQIDDTTPGVGEYVLQVQSPGCRAERFDVDFAHLPMTIRFARGLKLRGRVFEAGTGNVIPDAEVRAWTNERHVPQQTTRTDSDGWFEFDTLADETYQLFVDGANFPDGGPNKVKPGSLAVAEIKVNLYPGSRLAPKPPANAVKKSESAASERRSADF